jgi:glutamate--cysteine ligase
VTGIVPTNRIDRTYERRLAAVVNAGEPQLLQGGRRGVEKESLRVTPDGHIAATPHPAGLGAALTHEHITTDYSEALIELVTPTFRSNPELLRYLGDLHHFTYRHLGDELLWATSMPCVVDGDASIPLAQYGPSNVGRMKTVYREGLGLRYGRVMQAISGVHFNYSFPERLWEAWAAIRGARDTGDGFVSAAYFELLRNYRRHGWIALYLFGVSPAVCKSFLRARGETLPEFGRGTAWEPYATSLRMSDLGYRNRSQSGVEVSVNSLQDYVRDLTRAISTPHPEYERLGVKVDGAYRQLNANLLQIENEYYAFIRPKRVARSGERPTKALLRGGVEYVEVRSLDVSAFDPLGVDEDKLRFLEAFMAFCLMRESPPIDASEQAVLDGNHVTVARRGREPGLMLVRDGRRAPMQGWAREILDQMQGPCELLDAGDPAKPYAAALAVQAAKLDDPALTPSARLIAELRATGESFFDFALRTSAAHKAHLLGAPPSDAARLAQFGDEAAASLGQAEALARAPQADFDAFLAAYLA